MWCLRAWSRVLGVHVESYLFIGFRDPAPRKVTDGSARAQLGDPVEEGGVSPTPQVPVGVSSPTESLVATGFRTSYIPSANVGPRTDIPGSESGRVWVGGRQGPSLVGDGGLPCPFWDFSGRVGRRAITLRTHATHLWNGVLSSIGPLTQPPPPVTLCGL